MKKPDEELAKLFEANGIKVDFRKKRKTSVKVRAGKRVVELKRDGSVLESGENVEPEDNNKNED